MGFKASETLLGIETNCFGALPCFNVGFKASETLLGIETKRTSPTTESSSGFKASETILGIETLMQVLAAFWAVLLQSL